MSLRIELPHDALDCRSRARRIGEAAQQHYPCHSFTWPLEEREVEGARRLLSQAVVLGVFDDPDDLDGDVLKRSTLEAETPAQRVLVAKEVPRHCMVNDCGQRRARC